jgi:DNA-binding NarL/FixJ family response regulator
MSTRTELAAAVAAIAMAPFDASMWAIGLDRAAAATGSRMTQLIGLVDADAPLHWLSDDLSMTVADWIELGGATPLANPMIRNGLRLPARTTIIDVAVRSEENRAERALWSEFFQPCDVPHIASSVLMKEDDRHLAFSVMRRRREGPLLGDQLAAFEACAQAVANAVAVRQLIASQADRVLLAGLEAVEAAAIGFDRGGRVVFVSAAAERLARHGWFDVRNGRLRLGPAGRPHAWTDDLKTVFATGEAVKLTCRRGGEALTARFTPLQHGPDLWFGAAAIAELTVAADTTVLSAAEAEVHGLLRSGYRLSEVAEARGVSRETVRSQAKAIYQKLGVRDQHDLLDPRRHGGGEATDEPG